MQWALVVFAVRRHYSGSEKPYSREPQICARMILQRVNRANFR
jgi:hypothetical protein